MPADVSTVTLLRLWGRSVFHLNVARELNGGSGRDCKPNGEHPPLAYALRRIQVGLELSVLDGRANLMSQILWYPEVWA